MRRRRQIASAINSLRRLHGQMILLISAALLAGTTPALADTYYRLPSEREILPPIPRDATAVAEDGGVELPPVGASSLTFVFDRTGSMNDDLNQVRQGAKGIFETVMKQRKRFIHNYVLVLFHDPEVDPPFVSTDPDVFQQELASVSVQGGGDCPEMTLSGIKKALEVSLPGSYIYVFTDARSKDFHLEDRVLNLIQEKQSSVVFVMTGDCGNRTAPGYRVFERIAAASFGQVFHLEKAHVNTVLEYVRHAVAQRKVHILYEVREYGGQSHITQIPVDAHFSELTISVSGEREDGGGLDILLIDPQNRTVDKDTYAHEGGTIDLNSVKLIRIQNPQPGVWKARVASRLKHTIRIFGHGVIDFKYGFASRPVPTVDLAFPRPIAGQSTYLVVNMTGLTPPGMVVQLSLVDYYGRELFRNETHIHPRNPNLYFAGPFMPPKGFFFVRVNGEDEMNYEFLRIAPTAIATVETTGPRAYMAERITATAYQSVNLSCSVESPTPFTVHWLFGSVVIGGPLFYKRTDTSTWTIDAATPANRGHYTCHVSSNVGNDTAVTFLDSKEPPPHITASRNESVLLRGTAYLHCQTQSIERATIRWVRDGVYIGNSAKIYMSENGTLRILDAQHADAGAYTCRATTSGGQAEALVFLSVHEAPTAHVYPKELYAARGAKFNISCYATGLPRPEVSWFVNGAGIESNSKFYIGNNNQLLVEDATALDAGIFECRATNLVTSKSDFATVRLAVPPEIHIAQNQHLVGRGGAVVVDCRVIAGTPTPRITWHKDGREILSNQQIVIHGGRLTIRKATEIDAGTYACKAENIAGTDIKPISLTIGSAPTIVSSPSKVHVDIDRALSLQCRAVGVPRPSVEWRFGASDDARPLRSDARRTILPDDTLLIPSISLADEGTYTCVAVNAFGRREKQTTVIVTGLVSPILAHMPTEVQLIEGRELRLNCLVLMGNPKPKIHWLRDGQPFTGSATAKVEEDGSLYIENGSSADAASYSCVAVSAAGNASTSVRLNLIRRPTIVDAEGIASTHVEEHVVARAGAPLELACSVVVPHGQPPPKVLWTVDGRPIGVASSDFEILKDQTLRIRQVSRANSGRYACTAVNAAGEAERGVRVTILTPPTIVRAPQSALNLIKGDSISLQCEAEGDPQPDIRWQLNGVDYADGVVDENGALLLDSVDESHRGDFTCVAENELGDDQRTVTLTVHTAPVIEGSGTVKIIVANVSERVILPCPAVAFPPPQRSWYYENSKITLQASGNMLRVDEQGALVIESANLHHAGMYDCQVSNLAGDDKISYSLTVHSPPSIVSEVAQRNIFDGILGRMFDLPCRAIGTPAPSVTWETGAGLLIPSVSSVIGFDTHGMPFVDATGTLRFKALRLADDGEYRCVARNPAGEAHASVTLFVQVPPTVAENQPVDYSFVRGRQAQLDCQMSGQPTPTITWTRLGEPVTSQTQRHEIFENGTLRISELNDDDVGYYSCQGSNPAGKQTAVIRVSVVAPPEIREPDALEAISVERNASIALHCPVISSPTPEIKWYFNDQPVFTHDVHVTISEDKRRLLIGQAREGMAGVYRCVAQNSAGEASKTFQVDVLVAPHLDESHFSRIVRVPEDQSIELGCPANGRPPPGVVWLRNARQLDANGGMDGVRLGPNEDNLIIDKAKLSHNGTYLCVASNAAGSLDVSVELIVLAAPKLTPNENVESELAKPLTLICDVSNPDERTSITWLFNNSDVLPAGAKSLAPAQPLRLFVAAVDARAHGFFECVVRNSVGESRKRFDVDVLIPPQVTDRYFADGSFPSSQSADGFMSTTPGKAKEEAVRVRVGDLHELHCPVYGGNPPPQVRWLVDGAPLENSGLANKDIQHTVLEGGRTLAILGAANANHRYSCLLENKVGRASKEFFVQMIAPPKMELSTQSSDGAATPVEVFEGNSVTFECPLSGDTSATALRIVWLQDGATVDETDSRYSVSLDRTRLVVINARRSDRRDFACVAHNDAGSAEAHFALNVLVPPKIRGNLVEQLTVVEGEEVDLRCDADGTPSPDVTWMRGDQKIDPSDERHKFLNNENLLYIEEVKRVDAGIFVCVAENAAGKAKRTFELSVITRPMIAGSNVISQIQTLAEHPASFDCTLEGSLMAAETAITWLKPDGMPVNASADLRYQLLNDNRRLTVLRPDVGDTGAYVCVAQNPAGEAKKTFQLDIHSAPKILGDGDGKFRVVENSSLIIPCEADGRPPPYIVWTKDGEPLTAADELQFLSANQQLKIGRVSARHAGIYACTATNAVASVGASFHVEVVTRPAIAGDVSRHIQAIEGEDVTLVCPIEKYTNGGEVIWYHDDDLTPVQVIKYTNALASTNLHVNKASKMNEGVYTCAARNDAGESRAEMQLSIHTKPTILMLERQKNIVVLENGTATLSCPATGDPEPQVAWLRDGRAVAFWRMPNLAVDGNTMRISFADVNHTGQYTCEARNSAGVTEQEVQLQVIVPPRIERSNLSTSVSGEVGRRLSLTCPALGIPPPQIIWLKNGRPVEEVDGVYLSAGRQKLNFAQFTEAQVGAYTCVARNTAGEDSHEFSVGLLIEPRIDDANVVGGELRINVGRPATLSCPASGSPSPTIAWLRDGAPLAHDPKRHRLLNNSRQLEIAAAASEDSGRYTCIATNAVGAADLDFFLFVIDSPTIDGADTVETRTVVLNQAIELACNARGSAPLQIVWQRNGRPAGDAAGEQAFVQVSDRGRKLHLLSAQRGDATRWTCTATNAAGEAQKHIDLKVHVSPSINDSLSSPTILNVIPGDQFRVECIVDGIPLPTITWLKDGTFVNNEHFANNDMKLTNNGQSLWIRAAEMERDSGRYTCRAENSVGNTSRNIIVKVIGPPMIDLAPSGEPFELLNLHVGDSAVLKCTSLGGGGENVTTKWTLDGRSISTKNGGFTLENDKVVISNARLSDSGEYGCALRNDAGEAHKIFSVNVFERPRFMDTTNTHYAVIEGRPLIIDCSVMGTPRPHLTWTKDGKPVDGNNGLLIVNEGQQLHVEAVEARNAGRYSCIAENVPGRVEKDIVVSLLRAPVILARNQKYEVRENETQTLHCDVEGDQNAPAVGGTTKIEWSKNGLPLRPTASLQLSNNGKSLHITRVRTHDSATYSCHVSNEAGTDEATFDVIVLVPPHIQAPAVRNLDAQRNASVQLHCHVGGIPTPEIEWFLDGRQRIFGDTQSNGGYDLLGNGTTLRIIGVRLTQEGRYTCVAINKVGRAEADVFVSVIEPPQIYVAERDVFAIDGSDQRLECLISGIPSPAVEWRRNGNDAVNLTRWSQLAAVATLSANATDGVAPSAVRHAIYNRNVSVEDAGRYTCVATNRAGESRESIQVAVMIPPKILESERILRVVEGGQLTLGCATRALPAPDIQWSKDGVALDTPDTSFQFVLHNVSAIDSGRYTCEVINEAGSAVADFVVDVLLRPRLRDYTTGDLRVVEGERARMQCRADGNPEPTVEWLRGGRPIADMSNFILSPRGDALMILKTKRADAGTYSCNVKNAAGEIEAPFTVIVLTPPHIDQTVDQNPRIIVNKSVVLECPVLGHPQPEVTWLKNAKPLVYDANFLRDGPNNLRIAHVVVPNAGRFTCQAVNEVGELNTEYQLEVLAPPKFGAEGQRHFEVIERESVAMTCPVEAVPLPSIEWIREEKPVEADERVRITPDGKKLIIVEATLRDGGKYTCQATNVAGQADVDLILKVLVPPRIDKSNLINNPLVILGRRILLECPASGIPQPTIRWARDGVPIDFDAAPAGKYSLQQGNQSFGISHIDLVDHGEYTCEVENKGGRTSESFSIEVLVPPQMEPDVGTPTLARREGEPLTLICPVQSEELDADARAASELRISWAKNGRTLDAAALPENYELSKDGRRLQILTPQIDDAGQYKCVASNRAGQSHVKFNVEILSKPRIDTSRNDVEPHVVLGRPITLWCPASANPVPIIRWYRNGTPMNVSKDENYRLLDQGQGLELSGAAAADDAIWTCEAENPAGTAHLDINLDVWMEPIVHVEAQDHTAIKPVESSITLFCNVSGNPAPVITWTRDGQLIIPSPDGIHISLSGGRLDIPRLNREDAGRYECVAQNEVGAAKDAIRVDILLPPIIDREGIDLNPRLAHSRPLMLFCEAKGEPTPHITWFVNGTRIRPQNDDPTGSIIYGENGRFIKIANVTLQDTGVYKCEAQNSAGIDEISYKVDVHQAPQIIRGGTRQVAEGQVAVLGCESRGEPTPLTTWQRNGVLVETSERYIIDGPLLKIIDARSSDSGIYVCVATNEAGTDQQAFTLEILVPPKLVQVSANETTVAWGGNATLTCLARGYPTPQVFWTVDDLDLEQIRRGAIAAIDDSSASNDSGSGGFGTPRPLADALIEGVDYVLDAEQSVLHLLNVTYESRRTFTCSVVNDAGMDEISYLIKTISPPIITNDGSKMVNVSEGDPVRLNCDVAALRAAGDVTPAAPGKDGTIKWLKNDAPLTSSAVLSTDGAELTLTHAQLSDTGNYSCNAENFAGSATQYTQLNIGVSPQIAEKTARRRVLVKRGEDVELLCEAVGVPPPRIIWRRENASTTELDSTVSESGTDGRRSALFTAIEPEQAGIYSCWAENWAGKDSMTVDLVVLIPPQIYPERVNLTATLSETIILPCNASGIPEPVVSWVKVPNMDISSIEDKYQILGTSLAIKKTTVLDDGFYHCIAKSDAGQAIGVRKVSVQVSLDETPKRIWVECDENSVPVDTTFVAARGDTPQSAPHNYLPWSSERARLPANGTDGVTLVCLPNHARGPRRAPTNSAPRFVERPQSLKRLRHGEELRLVCSAIGSPTPEITWVDDQNLTTGLEQFRSKDGASILQLPGSFPRNVDLACVARNVFGTARAVAHIEIERRKSNKSDNPTKAKRQSVVSIFGCYLGNETKAEQRHVEWARNGRRLAASPNITDNWHVMNNGSLILLDDKKTAPLSCAVDGIRGEARLDGVLKRKNKLDSAPARVIIRPTRIFARPNTDVVIDCRLKAGEALTTHVRWTRNNIPLQSDFDRIEILPNNSLSLRRVQEGERASYKCLANNPFGKSWDDVDLIVEENSVRTVVGRLDGTVNGWRLAQLPTSAVNRSDPWTLRADVEPKTNANEILIYIDRLPRVATSDSEAATTLLGALALPLAHLSYDVGGMSDRADGYERIAAYSFETGETLRVRQGATELSPNTTSLSVDVDGRLPDIDTDRFWLDPFEEELAEEQPGLITGSGKSAINFGPFNESRIPFSWENQIIYKPKSNVKFDRKPSKQRLVEPGSTLHVRSQVAIDKLGVRIAARADRYGRCPTGYATIRGNCRDIDECALDKEACSFGAACQNTYGSFRCERQCADGWRADATADGACVDIDECALGRHACDQNAHDCVNTMGAYKCIDKCSLGFRHDSTETCHDVDECDALTQPPVCAQPAECANFAGGFKCLCPTGFSAKEGRCEGIMPDIPRLPLKNITLNSDWVGKTSCPHGFAWNADDHICVDVDECAFDAPCQFRCVNFVGSFVCECPDGYSTEANGQCIDVNECKADSACEDSELCFNQLGDYACIRDACPAEYKLNSTRRQCIPTCSNCTDLAPIYLQTIALTKSAPISGESLLRVSAHDKAGRFLANTRFRMQVIDSSSGPADDRPAPFRLHVRSGRATVRAASRLPADSTHRLVIQAISKLPTTAAGGRTKTSAPQRHYQTNFLIFIAVSKYDF